MESLERAGYEPGDQLAEIRRVLRRSCTSTHQLVELSVGKTCELVRQEAALRSMAVELRFEHKPLVARADYPEDPYHSEIFGTPPFDVLDQGIATAIGDLIALCVRPQYAAHRYSNSCRRSRLASLQAFVLNLRQS